MWDPAAHFSFFQEQAKQTLCAAEALCVSMHHEGALCGRLYGMATADVDEVCMWHLCMDAGPGAGASAAGVEHKGMSRGMLF